MISPRGTQSSVTRTRNSDISFLTSVYNNYIRPDSHKNHQIQHQRLNSVSKIFVLYNSSGIDKEMQKELVKAAFMALRDIDEEDIDPRFIDLSVLENSQLMDQSAMATVAKWIHGNGTNVIVSLLHGQSLKSFSLVYQTVVNEKIKADQYLMQSDQKNPSSELTVVTPRIYPKSCVVSGVKVLSLQMSEISLAVALLNRVEKVGVHTLIPVIDDSSYQLHLLQEFVKQGELRNKRIRFTAPVFLSQSGHLARLSDMLKEYTGIKEETVYVHDAQYVRAGNLSESFGILLLASQGSHHAMQAAAQKKHIHLGWFSPDFIEHEEWASQNRDHRHLNAVGESNGNFSVGIENNFYGMYSVAFVGSKEWDNAERRRALLEISTYTGKCLSNISFIYSFNLYYMGG